MSRAAGIRFKQAGKVFYYDAGELEITTGSYVVVETSHGEAIGRVVITPEQVIVQEFEEELKPIVRLATEADIEKNDELQERAKREVARAREKAVEQGLPIAIAGGEYDLGGRQFTAYFTAPERVDFRSLVRDLSQEIGARVQLLQVGDRDRAKLVDGVDICGERLCCASWMTNFPSVSIRMAKEQDLPLNPQKISGVCGRLYCCLTFEYEDYKALRGTLPKVGSFVSTPAGEARISSIDFIREVVRLYLTESQTIIEMAATDLKLQHGVTVRPMELVHRVEGPMRTISEDRSGRGRGQRPPMARPPRPGGRPEPVRAEAVQQQPPAEQEAVDGGQKRRRRRRRRGRGGGAPGGPPSTSETQTPG